jgi:hypothetical protein
MCYSFKDYKIKMYIINIMTKWSQFLELFSEKNQHLKGTELLQKAKTSFMKVKDYYEQYGGGNCSLCGSPGTTKSTCPRNPEATNPNPAKHPNASGAVAPAAAAPEALVRESSVKSPVVVRQKSVKMSDYIQDKVNTLGAASLTSEEIEYIIKVSTGLDKSSVGSDLVKFITLKGLIPDTKHRRGWVNCFTGTVVKSEEDYLYNQLVSRIQCYKKFSDERELIDVPKPVVKANSVKANAPASRPANQAQLVVTQKGKTAPADDDRGCEKQSDKKYLERKSPPYPANQCCGQKMQGNDGRMYESRADINGTCKWYLLKIVE